MAALTRKVPLRRTAMPRVAPKLRRMHPQVAEEVIARDLRIAGGCVPKYLGAEGPCKDQWGNEVRPDARETLRINHVREQSGGERRDDPRWLNAGCWFHNVQGWELTHVEELRAYLAKNA